MAYYYLTDDKRIYNKIDTFRVKLIYTHKEGRDGVEDIKQQWGGNGSSPLPKIVIPMIRRVFPQLITSQIVGVQPMSGPVGFAFALRHNYTSHTKGHKRYTKEYRRRQRNKDLKHPKDIMRIETFRACHNIEFESDAFGKVIFELIMKKL